MTAIGFAPPVAPCCASLDRYHKPAYLISSALMVSDNCGPARGKLGLTPRSLKQFQPVRASLKEGPPA